MFHLPEAKRVRREDLRRGDDSDSSDVEMDADLQARLNAQIAKSLGLDVDDAAAGAGPGAGAGAGADADVTGNRGDMQPEDQDGQPRREAADDDGTSGYAFRLFSTAGPTPKIVLEDPHEDVGDGCLLRPRPPSFYLAGPPSAELRAQYAFAAVTGDDVIARSRTRSWGMELPWRVTTIKVLRKKKGVTGDDDGKDEDDDGGGGNAAKRKRPGKKRRIAMRTKERAKVKAKEAAKQKEVDKEEHMKEKKKRMNRLKKLRKRAKRKGDKGEDDDHDHDDSGSE